MESTALAKYVSIRYTTRTETGRDTGRGGREREKRNKGGLMTANDNPDDS